MSRYDLIEIDGQLEVVPAEPTPSMRKASRGNGRKGGRPKGSGQGRAPALKRHLTAAGDEFLAQVRDAAELKSHAEALELIRKLWGERIPALIKGPRKKAT